MPARKPLSRAGERGRLRSLQPGVRAKLTIGLYFFNTRWYDTALGRWAQPDSIVPLDSQGAQAWDRYAAKGNNPVRFVAQSTISLHPLIAIAPIMR